MTDTEKKLYEPLDKHKLDHLAHAIEELAQALGERYQPRIPHRVASAQRYISRFFEEINPSPELSNNMMEISAYLHTCLRKYCDDMVLKLKWNYLRFSS